MRPRWIYKRLRWSDIAEMDGYEAKMDVNEAKMDGYEAKMDVNETKMDS